MESKEATGLNSKKKKPGPKTKNSPKKSPFQELAESQIVLFKTCNELLSRINSMELQMVRIAHYNAVLVKENEELKNFLDTMAKKMIESREDVYSSNEFGPPEIEKKERKKVHFSKKAPLHDDVTKSCDACGTINHINEKKCIKCGLKK